MKLVLPLCSDSVDSIGSTIAQSLCYHDLNQSKTVVQIKLQNMFCRGKISYDANSDKLFHGSR